MLFLHTLPYRWWFGSYNSNKAMVDCQGNLESWLEDATFFPNEPFDVLFDFDELVTASKASNEVDQTIPFLPDLGVESDGWLDEKVDLSIFDYPNSLLIQPNEAETLIVEDAATILESLMDGSFDTSYLPTNSSENKLENDEYAQRLDVLNFDEDQAGTSVDSPVTSVDAGPYSPISCVSSPASTIDSGITSDSSVSVTPCSNTQLDASNTQQKPLKISEVFSLTEVAQSVKSKKFTGDSNKIPSLHVSLKQSFHPYSSTKSKGSQPRKENRYERKKVQNKEAAARYRIKKRVEEQEMADVISGLEHHQNDLKEKHDQLQNEIKYLKSLMQEMFRAKGILK